MEQPNGRLLAFKNDHVAQDSSIASLTSVYNLAVAIIGNL